jgi:hypothetical protein
MKRKTRKGKIKMQKDKLYARIKNAEINKRDENKNMFVR